MLLLPALSRRSLISMAAFAAVAVVSAAAPASARSNRDQDDAVEATSRTPGKPVMAVVSLGDQRVTIYDKDGAIMHGPISSGATPNDTPPGIYAILQKNREHYSNRYDDAAMPFMQRITWTGIALHAGALPGYPASHGCVRLRHDFAGQLFDMTKLGMRVVVSRNNMEPVAISHPGLFKPKPFRNEVAVLTPAAISVPQQTADSKGTRYDGGPNDPPELATRTATLQAIAAAKTAEADELGKKAEAARALAKQKQRESAKAARDLKNAENALKRATSWLADSERILSRATKEKAIKRAEDQKAKAEAKVAETKAKLVEVQAKTKPALDEAQRAEEIAKAAETEKATASDAARAAERKLSPVSVFVSRQTGKIYIRQAFEQIYEGDVVIHDPTQPIGTHIYTAVDYKPGGREMQWNVVSIAGRQPGEPEKSSGMNRVGRGNVAPIPTDLVAATSALDRVEIPKETMDQISELVLPGSSLIISDEAAHKETGKATDFIVLLSGEPQGGIILRPKPKPEFYDDYWGYGGGYGYGPQYGYDRRRQKKGPFFGGGGKFPWW